MAEEQISIVLKANIDNYNKNMSIAAGVLKDLQKQSTEFMKINNGVEDSFTKIDFAAKKFGETAGVLEKKLVVVKKAMTDLVVAGQANTKAFKDLDNQYKIITNRLENKAMAEAQAYAQTNMTTMSLPKMSKGLDQASVSLKKNNMQMTNLALVLQDLPYGFRGIQNNLPALVGGMAGMTGGVYLAASAVIALFTAWDNGLFKVKNSTSTLNDIQKAYNETLKSSMGSAGEEISKMNALVSIAANHEVSMEKRLSAVKKLQDEYPSYFGNLDKEKILNGDVATSVDSVKLAIIERAKATAISSKINAIAAEKFVEEEKLYQLALQKTVRMQKDIALATSRGYKGKALKGYLDFTLFDIREKEKEIGKVIDSYDSELNRLGGLYAKSTEASLGLEDGKPKPTTTTKPTLKQNDSLLNSLKAEQQLYKDDMFMKRAIGLDVLKEEERLAVEKATFEKASIDTLLNLANEFKFKRLAVQQETIDELQKMRNADVDAAAKYEQKLIEAAEKANQIKKQNAIDIANAIRGINQKFLNDDITSIQNKAKFDLKLNKNNRKANIQSLKDANKELLALKESQFNADKNIDTSGVDQGIENNLSQIALLEQTWKDTANSINSSINNLISNGITLLADSLGKAFAGESVDIFNSLGLLIADALINVGKSLIEYATLVGIATALFADPLTWPVALGVGIAAVAAGAFLKSKLTKKEKGVSKFADGGIVSGPTMGLMGEYPGAKSNPEVIAPLDKLKGLMGGGGGTLEARISGNDLLILMNKAQRNNNTTF
jgi:hypothetical protein